MNPAPSLPHSSHSLDARELRRALGSFATGVIVVTAAYDGGEHGMTANSFASVSMQPPLVLVCIDNDARMARVLERGMHCGLSVLACGQERLSRHFAGRTDDHLAVEFAWYCGVPVIAGALAHFICRVTDCYVTGDHTVQIAAVEQFACFERAPLLFYSGAYCRVQRGEATAVPR